MAVKFSQFTTASSLSDISYLVGYKGTANVQITPSLLAGTTYSLDVPTATTNINLAGSNSTNDAITLTGGTDITLTRVSASEISIASTASGDTYTLGATTDGSNVDLNLDAAAGSDSTVQLTAGTGMTISQSGGNNVTFASTSGDTYTLQAGAKAGSSVPLQLDASTGSDTAVNLTEGSGITLTQNSATEITVAATASGTTVVKDQFTGNNSTTAFTLSVTPTAADNLNIFISGVYQNSKDSGGTANYIVAGTTLTFATAPPTTAANGIEVVITQ
jgi:hypothetical protein